MRRIVLDEKTVGGIEGATVLLAGMQDLISGPRVYKTHVRFNGTAYVFATISKDLHLAMGAVPTTVQFALAKIVDDNTPTGAHELLITFPSGKVGNERRILYTVTRARGQVFIMMSSA